MKAGTTSMFWYNYARNSVSLTQRSIVSGARITGRKSDILQVGPRIVSILVHKPLAPLYMWIHILDGKTKNHRSDMRERLPSYLLS